MYVYVCFHFSQFIGGMEMAKATPLKKELERLVKNVVDDEDSSVEAIDQVKEILCALKELKKPWKGSASPSLEVNCSCPDEFLCPIAKEIMGDPVVISSGVTYDRSFIERLLVNGNRICPQTQEVLMHDMLIPNLLIRRMISQWGKSWGIELSEPVENDERLSKADREHLFSLLNKMSSTVSNQKNAAKELRLLTKRKPEIRAVFGESVGALSELISPIIKQKFESLVDRDLEEDVITTILNISINENNKKVVAETPFLLAVLRWALSSGKNESRGNAAAALFTLSAIDSNKEIIGKAGFFEPLLDLIKKGDNLTAIKDAASAIFNLCLNHQNKVYAVEDGAVKVLSEKIANRVHVDELLSILALISSEENAIVDMRNLCAVPCLLKLIRENTTSRCSKENGISILYSILLDDQTYMEVGEDELAHGSISELSRHGTSRAKRKAKAIIKILNRAAEITRFE